LLQIGNKFIHEIHVFFFLSLRPRELLLLLLQMMMNARKTERQLFIDEKRSRLFFSRDCMMK